MVRATTISSPRGGLRTEREPVPMLREPMIEQNPGPSETPRGSRPRRILLVTMGVVLVGLGAVGAVLPGLPTTVFLLGASWCFARSCPWLEERMLNAKIFRPFHPWLRGEVSRRARAGSMILMWIAISISAFLFVVADPPRYALAGVVVGLGFIGTWFIARHGNGAKSE